MKHNNVIPNAHFRKDWKRYVKTWFNQPAKKIQRRATRVAKAAKLAPRPLNSLRPAVHCTTIKYNRRVRLGRGFTFDELKAAGITRHEARGIGITVDHRRKNRSEEGFRVNVDRLKRYKSKLVIFPRKACSQKVKKGDSTVEQRKAVAQVTDKFIVPLPSQSKSVKTRKITEEERNRSVQATLRKAFSDAKLWGVREKRAKDKLNKKDDKQETTQMDE